MHAAPSLCAGPTQASEFYPWKFVKTAQGLGLKSPHGEEFVVAKLSQVERAAQKQGSDQTQRSLSHTIYVEKNPADAL